MWILKKKDTDKTSDSKNITPDKKKTKSTDKASDKKKTKSTDKTTNKKTGKEKQTVNFTEKDAHKALNANKEKAKELLKDKDSMNDFLSQVNDKFKTVTGLGNKLAEIPIIISLVRAYIKGEYRQFPLGSLIGLVAALIYFVSPIDAIPDALPVIGYIDDIMVFSLAVKFAYTDLEEYKKWLAKKEEQDGYDG